MSAAMFAAIRRRKMEGLTSHTPDHGKEHEAVGKPGEEMADKSQSQNISKGHASPTEQAKIAEKMREDTEAAPYGNKGAPADMEEASEGDHKEMYGENESDELAKSMLDSRFREGIPEGMKPRGLGDRMKMNLANKLKAKGKL